MKNIYKHTGQVVQAVNCLKKKGGTTDEAILRGGMEHAATT